MLESLFGTPIIERVLFFLMINHKCYAFQLKEVFQNPLYSFQRALARLEKGGIIVSSKEGKTLVYQFNPQYPFLPELESFLQKAYSFSLKKYGKNTMSQSTGKGHEGEVSLYD